MSLTFSDGPLSGRPKRSMTSRLSFAWGFALANRRRRRAIPLLAGYAQPMDVTT